MEKHNHGFTLKSTREVGELAARLHELEHEKSGAKLVWLERAEENKTFAIAFQTQPWDDTGVFHILEHSVLCGSDRYPVKAPFVELMKSSLNTFLNAMTFPDKTVYPVSSRNEQDFLNLTRVYMDAALHPLLRSKPEILGQEGWHYELDENGEPSCKGVVFNEMKGAMSSPDEILDGEARRRLFPDTCYRWNYGGDPVHIPELTWERFTAAHKRLYHPSNAYIFLDGHMDIDRVLGILDGEYLSAYDRAPAPGPIPFQPPVDGGAAEIEYELSSEEEPEGRARLADGFVFGSYADIEELDALEVLFDVLCGDNQAPLKKRLLDEGLAKDVRLGGYLGGLQPSFTLEARDVREDRLEEVSAAVYDELERLVREGLDHRRIRATLDNREFRERERDFGREPQGVVFAISVMESWLYGGDPAARLVVGDTYDRLRAKCDEGWFEKLLERALLKNPHRCRVVMRPSHTLGQERQEAETRRLKAAQAAWGREGDERVRAEQARIDAWQNAPDTPEQLATIPMLRLDQIPAQPEELPLEETELAGLPALRHALPTGGITYVNLYFALDDLGPEGLARAAFLCQLLGSLGTASHALEDLQRELRSLFGNLEFSVEPYGELNQPGKCRTFLRVSASMLDAKAERAAAMLAEILTETKLDEPEKVYALLCQRRADLLEKLAVRGDVCAMYRVGARTSVQWAVQEHTGGITYFRWLRELENGFRERFPALRAELEELSGTLFHRGRLTLSVTAGEPGGGETAAAVLAARLPEGSFSLPAGPAVRPWERKREGVVIPGDVSFAALGGPFPGGNLGGARVMGRAASLAYLWNAVRVQGGAYGVGMGVLDDGMAVFRSFRDPSADRTLDCYRKTPEFLEGLAGADLTGFILGAVAESDPLLTPRLKGTTADSRYWRRATPEALRRAREEMLSATPEDLSALAGTLRRTVDEGSVCVLGSRKQVEACAGELDGVEEL